MNKIRKDIKNRRKQGEGGFTLIELVVAIGIMLILAAVATPFLLGHIKDAKVASLNEQVLNINAAFDSYYTKEGGILTDSDGDGNYLDDMIDAGWLSNDPSGKNGLNWTIERYEDASHKVAYYVKITNADASGYSYITDLASTLDEAIDGTDDGSNGRFQYNNDTTNSNFTGYYLLHADPGMSTWHS